VVLNGGSAAVTREVDAGLETIDIDLPAVISVDLRLNEPRFVKLPDIMKAKRKPLDVLSLDELGVSTEGNLEVGHHAPPAEREKGIMVEDTAQLVQELKNRGLI
jgi:electron transfer flavoprotein beta subunit